MRYTYCDVVSVVSTVQFCIVYLVESKIEEKGSLEATKNIELLYFLVWEREREREFGDFGPRFAGVRNFLVSEICFHMWGGKLASLERGKSHS